MALRLMIPNLTNINLVKVIFRDSEAEECLVDKDEAELVGEDITQRSGGSSVIHKIPPFTVEDNTKKYEEISYKLTFWA